jgi:hypothetical protein
MGEVVQVNLYVYIYVYVTFVCMYSSTHISRYIYLHISFILFYGQQGKILISHFLFQVRQIKYKYAWKKGEGVEWAKRADSEIIWEKEED